MAHSVDSLAFFNKPDLYRLVLFPGLSPQRIEMEFTRNKVLMESLVRVRTWQDNVWFHGECLTLECHQIQTALQDNHIKKKKSSKAVYCLS